MIKIMTNQPLTLEAQEELEDLIRDCLRKFNVKATIKNTITGNEIRIGGMHKISTEHLVHCIKCGWRSKRKYNLPESCPECAGNVVWTIKESKNKKGRDSSL